MSYHQIVAKLTIPFTCSRSPVRASIKRKKMGLSRCFLVSLCLSVCSLFLGIVLIHWINWVSLATRSSVRIWIHSGR
jgi:hypothetical protein